MRALAAALVAGAPDRAKMQKRCAVLLGREWKWVTRLIERYLLRFAGVRPRRRQVLAWLRKDAGFLRATERFGNRIVVVQWLGAGAEMRPVEAALEWGLPEIASVAELATWLRIGLEELSWFTGERRGWNRTAAEVDHYICRLVQKRNGGMRLIEEPRERLKTLQRRLLAGILDHVPVHGAVHGFVRNRSIVSYARPHVGREVVLRMDLQNFFPGFDMSRVAGLFRTMGYPEVVADGMTGICTHAVRGCVLPAELRQLYGRSHLPQGAPSSPALANMLCRRLDLRLAGLAQAAGGSYTRYADDLAFSGDEAFLRGITRFAAHVAAICAQEGLAVNHRKTRVMRRGVRQALAGLVVNDKVGVGRAEFDRLKATLHHCVATGIEEQNREGRREYRGYLEGRVAFVESVDAARGAKLRNLLGRVRS